MVDPKPTHSTDSVPSAPATEAGAFDRLHGRIAEELAHPAPAAAASLSRALRERHGDAVAGILFYGSCLRKDTHEGVLDFYVVVDSYRAVYGGAGWQAAANALLPPSVIYLEHASPELGTTLRTKYAVISLRDFEACVAPGCLHPYIWARFAQPAMLTFARDEESRRRLTDATAQAVVTLVQRLVVFLPVRSGAQRFSLAALWLSALRRTYGSELRTEAPETIRGNYEADPDRYDELGTLSLEVLHERGWLEDLAERSHAVEIRMSRHQRLLGRLRWWCLRPLAKTLALLRLLKSAATFGDWLPYVLWKIERHSGVAIEPSARQRRYPLIFGWPVILKLLAGRTLR